MIRVHCLQVGIELLAKRMEKCVETEESMLILMGRIHPTAAVNIHVADKAFASSNKDEA